MPLLTTVSGDKIGKSAGNAVWLSPDKTSCYQFYQYFVRTTDVDVASLLKFFTFLSLNKIQAIMEEHQVWPLIIIIIAIACWMFLCNVIFFSPEQS